MVFQRAVVVVKPHMNFDFPGKMAEIAIEALGEYCNLDLRLIGCRKVQFTDKMAKDFYAEHAGKNFFPLLIEASTMGPCIVFVLEGVGAIDKIREKHGPTNPPDCRPDQLRKKYGRPERGRPYNAFHCTATPGEFLREYQIAYKG